MAKELKSAGLAWRPRDRDAFIVPDRGLDDMVFVITNMATRVQLLQGYPTVTFQGAYEWALDYIFLREVVWMPSEAQLRNEIEGRLKGGQGPTLRLTSTSGGYVCEINDKGAYLTFSGPNASVAYAHALLHLLG
ncbi:MAG: pilus assembly protein CpaE [Anaerolineae bacterium]